MNWLQTIATAIENDKAVNASHVFAHELFDGYQGVSGKPVGVVLLGIEGSDEALDSEDLLREYDVSIAVAVESQKTSYTNAAKISEEILMRVRAGAYRDDVVLNIYPDSGEDYVVNEEGFRAVIRTYKILVAE